MELRELAVPDAIEVRGVQHADDRGMFLEWFRSDILESATGRTFELRQGNLSVSRRGVLRGIHYTDIPPGQAKYVTAVHGAVLDFVVDVRVGSPAFGTWDTVLLDDVHRRGVFIPEGLGHAFVALSDDAIVSYLVTDFFSPGREHAIDPLDPDIGLRLPPDVGGFVLSEKDRAAPSLRSALANATLPTWEQARARYARAGASQ